MRTKQLKTALLAGVAAALLTAQAGAVSAVQSTMLLTLGGGSAMVQAGLESSGLPTAPPAQDSKSIGFYGLEKTVRSYNQTIQSLEKSLAGIGSTDVSSQFDSQRFSYGSQNSQLQKQAEEYEQSAKDLWAAAEKADVATKAALTAQAAQMDTLAKQARASIAMNNAILDGLDDAEEDAQQQLDDTYAATKKQVENTANQLVMGAQTQYVTLCTLADSVTDLERSIAALDRNIAVVEKQYEIGMVSALDVETIKNQRIAAVSGKTTLESQIASLENALSLTLGNDAGTTVHVQQVPEVTAKQLREMNYDKDLEQAQANSYTLWQKKDALRQASNDYEDDVTSTLDAYNAAKIDLAAAEEQLKNDFRALYNDVTEKKRLVDESEEDLALAETNFTVSQTKYDQGMLSQLDYLSAQDTLETARAAVQTAKTNLFTSYNTYQWAVRGVMN